ncbi:hypothetical protein K0M31_020320 [Melipona bicolor]|uniref:Secreted protein n=1 Tax=Melipona bicolor TaxID=60889 RepID=A0AA40KQV0_9HYME|nr:hypothetical protein K0M31_020320 [Melipona bicolor]
MAVHSSVRFRIHWVCVCVCALCTDKVLHTGSQISIRVLCRCGSGGVAVRVQCENDREEIEVCEATEHNRTEPMWFFGRLVRVSLAHLARESGRLVQPQRQGGC